jgi:acetoin utilization deacetylase AcuC-like enzyme
VLISAWFDADHRDPLAGMQATEEGFRAMTRVVMRIAHEHADGRVAAILEGGYDLSALRAAVPAVLDELAGVTLADPLATPHPRGAVRRRRERRRPYWDLPA